MNIVGVVRCVGFILVIGISTGRSQQWVPVAMPDSLDQLRLTADELNPSHIALGLTTPKTVSGDGYSHRRLCHYTSDDGGYSWRFVDSTSVKFGSEGDQGWVQLLVRDSVTARITAWFGWEHISYSVDARAGSGKFSEVLYPEDTYPISDPFYMNGTPWLTLGHDSGLINLMARQPWTSSFRDTTLRTVYLSLFASDKKFLTWKPLVEGSNPSLALWTRNDLRWTPRWFSTDFALVSSATSAGMFALHTSEGLFVTHDSSRTWTSPVRDRDIADIDFSSFRTRCGTANKLILLHPQDQLRAYCIWPCSDSKSFLLRSLDGLRTMQSVLTLRHLYSIASHTKHADIIAALGDTLFVSRDGGKHWADTIANFPDGWLTVGTWNYWIHLGGGVDSPIVYLSDGRKLWTRQLPLRSAQSPVILPDHVLLTTLPHPVGRNQNTMINIHGIPDEHVSIHVYDALGRIKGGMRARTDAHGEARVTLSPAALGLSPGVYWISAVQNSLRGRTRFLVE